MTKSVQYGTKEYLEMMYDIKEGQAVKMAETIKEVLEFSADHPHLLEDSSWMTWAQNIESNISIDDLPYLVVKSLWARATTYAEVQALIGKAND